MNSDQRLRARIVLILVTVVAAFLVSALYWIQIRNGEAYSQKAEQQYAKPTLSLYDRGNIYFESKDGTKIRAASIASGYVLYMDPSKLTDKEGAYDALSQFVDLDRDWFIEKASTVTDRYRVLASRMDAGSALAIKKMQLPGIGVSPINWRSYPGSSLASHALGIVGEDARSSSVTGRYGLERSYERILSRRASSQASNVFAQLFGGLNAVFGSSIKNEGDIVTSIEPSTQRQLEKVLAETENLWKPDEIGAIIMDPRTGRILAMASLPDFDPNDIGGLDDVSILSNPLVEHVYEMGSILKPLTMAVALDTGAVTTASTYEDTGSLTLSGKKISNYDGMARGRTNMQEILSQSLNVGSATLALKVGKEEFSRYFLDFGLGQKTGIDEPNEAVGLVGNLLSGRDIEIATAAYGQGIAVSPVGVVRALSALANQGYLVKPHLVTEIDYSDGRIEKTEIEKEGPYLEPGTVEEVTRMLVRVVDEKIAKAHPQAKWDNYSIAAKTGTAQIPDPKNGGYHSDRYLHSFFGYFPAYDPEFIVFLYQVYPKGAQYASETLTDPFSDIVKFLINYYDVTPDR